MEFSLEKALQILEKTSTVIRSMLQHLDKDWVLNNEGGESWSPFDVVGHLIHGEKTDWMPRLRIILSDNPDKTFVPFDRFAQFEASKGKSLDMLLSEFESLRTRNLEDLNALNLGEADFSSTGIHPSFGQVSLKELIATWAVHDLGHIAQVARVMAKQWKAEVGPWQEYLPILHR